MAKKEEVQAEAAAPVNTNALTVQDLIIIKNIIDITSARGAIRADEMSLVGGLYRKLVGFLVDNGIIKTGDPAKAEDVAQAETPAQGE